MALWRRSLQFWCSVEYPPWLENRSTVFSTLVLLPLFSNFPQHQEVFGVAIVHQNNRAQLRDNPSLSCDLVDALTPVRRDDLLAFSMLIAAPLATGTRAMTLFSTTAIWEAVSASRKQFPMEARSSSSVFHSLVHGVCSHTSNKILDSEDLRLQNPFNTLPVQASECMYVLHRMRTSAL